jgi:sugar (pentulose or hexulose) kinase
MPESLQCIKANSIITGWDFSTGAVKCLAFDLKGNVLAQVRFATDLWTDEETYFELNLMQLEGQARASTRAVAAQLLGQARLHDWIGGGISATHHTSGRIDVHHNQVRRAICWNDQTLAEYHARGLKRLGGDKKVAKLIGGPWAIRYSLSHLVKDESTLKRGDWKRTKRILPHGPLSAGYLTGEFDVISVSSAASTGMMDLRKEKWCKAMLGCLKKRSNRKMAWDCLPRIIDMDTPVGPIADHLAFELGLGPEHRPLVMPTLDDQAAGLVGGGAVDDGQVAVILGNSAVVNLSSRKRPKSGNLDVMKLNWDPYLWMRCYSNGAQFLDRIVGKKPKWKALEKAARAVPAGCNGTSVLPFVLSEPSLGIAKERFEWIGGEPTDIGLRYRASLEALAYLIALGVREHADAGQNIERITVSGGISQSDLMCEILATVLDRRIERLISNEGPALGAAVTALAGLENHLRNKNGVKERYTVADAVSTMVQFRGGVEPVAEWRQAYKKGLAEFERLIDLRATT